jgi:hypothetical protein
MLINIEVLYVIPLLLQRFRQEMRVESDAGGPASQQELDVRARLHESLSTRSAHLVKGQQRGRHIRSRRDLPEQGTQEQNLFHCDTRRGGLERQESVSCVADEADVLGCVGAGRHVLHLADSSDLNSVDTPYKLLLLAP